MLTRTRTLQWLLSILITIPMIVAPQKLSITQVENQREERHDSQYPREIFHMKRNVFLFFLVFFLEESQWILMKIIITVIIMHFISVTRLGARVGPTL